MKLLNHCLKFLSAGVVTWVTTNSLHAQGVPHIHDADCAAEHDHSCDGSCDGGCDGTCGPLGGRLGGRLGGGPGMFGGPGLMGGGPMMGGGHSIFGACRGCGVYGPCSEAGVCGSCGGLGGMGSGLGGDMLDCNQFGASNGDPMCPSCGYQGCPRCGWGLGLLVASKAGNLINHLLPYTEGGVSAPRWFDLSAEAVFLQRTKGPSPFNYTSLGAGSGNFVLTNDNVQLDDLEAGLGLQANIQLGVASSLEGVFFGLNRWNASATAFDNPNGAANLFSFISAFGTDPINGFDDSDRSLQQSLNYTSTLNNGEVNFRKRWTGRYRWFQGSWLAGIRYIDIGEDLTYATVGQNNNAAANNGARFFNYDVATSNAITVFQMGGDLWLNVVPGIKVGTELKFGVGGNNSRQTSTITANSINNLVETVGDSREAFVTSLSIPFVYRVSYSVAIRSSYQLLYVDNVALASDNFNSTPPALILPNAVRTVTLNNDAEVLYTGFTIGAEYTW